MKKLFATLALCLSALSAVAADVCAEGDKKCGPDGIVMNCERAFTGADAKWWSSVTRKCEGPAANSGGSSSFNRNDNNNNNRQVCSEGMSRCGADHKVERCSNGVWRSGGYERC